MKILEGLTQLYGYEQPTDDEKLKVAGIIHDTPNGPTSYDVALSFVSRYAKSDPRSISQWPVPAAWNPLIVEFFTATTTHASNDMIAWCAAFVNWCVERAGGTGSRDAASQSFLNEARFKRVPEPTLGDLAVFTCYKLGTTNSLGLGHVGFVNSLPANGSVEVLGGNQSVGGVSMICIKNFLTGDVETTRTVDGTKIACTRRLNCYVSVAPI